jgi:hypothetical protein
VANNEIPVKSRRKRKVLQILIVFLVVVIACFAFFRLILKSKLQVRLVAIRSAGYPATCVELDDWYTIPESVENAADCVIEAFSHFHKLEETGESELMPVVGKAELPARTEPLAQKTKDLIAQHLADNQEALDLLYKGAAIEHCRYPIDLSKGFEALMPYLSDFRTGARLLKLEAALHAENGKPQLAADSITSMLGLARSLSKEPVLISQLVRLACQGLAVSALEHVINRTEFADEQLIKLRETLADGEDLPAMHRAFAAERCVGVGVFEMPAAKILQVTDGGSSQPAVLAIALYKFAGLADMDAIKYIDLMNDYMKAIRLPSHERQDAADAINAKFEKIAKIHVILHMIVPALSRVATIDIRTIAHLRTAQVGLAIERYRLATGSLPKTLAEIVPVYLDAIPKDPFDGKDLRYKKLEAGFVVYSIGEDESDDGGKEKQRKKSSSTTGADVTFIVQR